MKSQPPSDASHAVHVLLVEDEESHAELMLRAFAHQEQRVHVVRGLDEARSALGVLPFDIVIADWLLPDGSGLELIDATDGSADLGFPLPLRGARSGLGASSGVVPVLLITSHGDERLAADAIKAGAIDYIVKSPESLANMPHVVDRALREWEVRRAHAKAEEDLRLAQIVVDNSPTILFRRRATDRWPVAFVSRNVRQLGYSADDLLSDGGGYLGLIHPDDRDRVVREVADFAAAGLDRFQQEYRLLTKDGRARWVDDRSRIERDGHGTVTHFQAVVLDISERKEADDERRRLALAVEHLAEMVVITAVDGRVQYVNPAFERVTGYPRADVMGRVLDTLRPSDGHSDFNTRLGDT
ncbi:MAG: PAS domain S-box protein, partial [Myxococcales bacterium]